MKKLVIGLAVCSLAVALCHGQDVLTTPLQVTLLDPVQMFSDEADVIGLRLNVLYGVNRNVGGLDVGLCNEATKGFAGIGVGGFVNFSERAEGIYLAGLGNLTVDGMAGLEIAGLMNLYSDAFAKKTSTWRGLQLSALANAAVIMRGVQVCGLGNMADDMKGVELAGLGNIVDTISGLQLAGLINLGWNVEGAQISALYNRADTMNGLQFALVNRARRMHGMQIGLLNITEKNLSMSVVPFVNAEF
jgi:hypothetical protein